MEIEEQLWADYCQQLYRFLVKRTGNPDLAQDLVQETVLKALNAKEKLKDPRKLKSWLFTIARNTLTDSYRTSSSHESFDPQLHDGEVTEEEKEDHSMVDCLTSMAQHLPVGYREAVVMSDLQGIKQKLVAERLGMSLSGAKSRVQRGRLLLKEKLFECCPLRFDPSSNQPIGCASGCGTPESCATSIRS